MALAKMSFDELNRLVGFNISEPYDKFFEPMQISEAQKRKRIELAEHLESVFLALLAELFYTEQYNRVSESGREDVVWLATLSSDIYIRASEAYMDAISESVEPDQYLYDHCMSLITEAVEVLYRHRDEPYYYSHDRAKAIAENDANSVFNHTEFEDAVKKKNYKYKTWRTIMDGRERDSHAELNGVRIPIEEPFEAQGGLLMFPRDDSLGASESELASCRCSLKFS